MILIPTGSALTDSALQNWGEKAWYLFSLSHFLQPFFTPLLCSLLLAPLPPLPSPSNVCSPILYRLFDFGRPLIDLDLEFGMTSRRPDTTFLPQ